MREGVVDGVQNGALRSVTRPDETDNIGLTSHSSRRIPRKFLTLTWRIFTRRLSLN